MAGWAIPLEKQQKADFTMPTTLPALSMFLLGHFKLLN